MSVGLLDKTPANPFNGIAETLQRLNFLALLHSTGQQLMRFAHMMCTNFSILQLRTKLFISPLKNHRVW